MKTNSVVPYGRIRKEVRMVAFKTFDQKFKDISTCPTRVQHYFVRPKHSHGGIWVRAQTLGTTHTNRIVWVSNLLCTHPPRDENLIFLNPLYTIAPYQHPTSPLRNNQPIFTISLFIPHNSLDVPDSAKYLHGLPSI